MGRVRDGDDVNAFALLAGRYRPGLRAFFTALLPREMQKEADDLTQETLLRLWQSRRTWEPTGAFSSYLFQIARHHFANQRVRYRAIQSHEILLNGDGDTGGMAESSGLILYAPARTQPEAILLEQWEAARIRRAAQSLPPGCRAVFILSHFDGLTQQEIACRLNVPLGTVKSRLFDAVRRLRVRLTPDFMEE